MNMETKKPFTQKLEAFFAGKGFYIVLALCLTVIGASAWAMLSGTAGETEALGSGALPVAELTPEDALPVVGGTLPSVVLTEAPAAAQAPEETAAPAEAQASPAHSGAVELPEATLPAGTETRPYFVWPVAGELEREYSVEALRFDPTMQDWRTHDGVDVAAALGEPVRAAGDGRVTAVYEDDRWGTVVVIAHGDGLTGFYANLAATPTVAQGQTVNVGQVIGSVGSTALCEIGEASHLHFALYRDGVSVDPGTIVNS